MSILRKTVIEKVFYIAIFSVLIGFSGFCWSRLVTETYLEDAQVKEPHLIIKQEAAEEFMNNSMVSTGIMVVLKKYLPLH